jgi:hypothetical protein
MPDSASLAVYAAILKLKAEYHYCWMAEQLAHSLINQSPSYTPLKPLCEICGREGNEIHHIAGRKHSYHTITVCCKCHHILSNTQKLWDKRWWQQDQPEHVRQAFLLQGISEILRLKSRITDNSTYERLADLFTEAISKRLRA